MAPRENVIYDKIFLNGINLSTFAYYISTDIIFANNLDTDQKRQNVGIFCRSWFKSKLFDYLKSLLWNRS